MFYPTTCVRFGTGAFEISLADFLGSLISASVRLPEGARYCQVRHSARICLRGVYLHPLTNYSVSPRTFHFSVPASLSNTVTES